MGELLLSEACAYDHQGLAWKVQAQLRKQHRRTSHIRKDLVHKALRNISKSHALGLCRRTAGQLEGGVCTRFKSEAGKECASQIWIESFHPGCFTFRALSATRIEDIVAWRLFDGCSSPKRRPPVSCRQQPVLEAPRNPRLLERGG
jgi:hypothetical protein